MVNICVMQNGTTDVLIERYEWLTSENAAAKRNQDISQLNSSGDFRKLVN